MSWAPPPSGPPSGPPGFGPPPPGPPGGPPGFSGYGPPPPVGQRSPTMGPPPQQSYGLPPGGAPIPPIGGNSSTVQDTVGRFEGCEYRIDHRDSNSILQLNLQPGYEVKGRPGSMVCMAGTVQVKGKFKFSVSKMVTGGEMAESYFAGPGELVLAPEIWGDIVPITIQPNTSWSCGKDAFLACTPGVQRTTKSQGFGKALLSGEGLFVAKLQGNGVFFAQSIGAIIKRDLRPGEQWIVDNGHLVAWSASYSMERINTAGGGFLSGHHTGEGMVCRFTGPGTVYIQSRNPESLGLWIASQAPRAGGGGGGGGGGGLVGALLS